MVLETIQTLITVDVGNGFEGWAGIERKNRQTFQYFLSRLVNKIAPQDLLLEKVGFFLLMVFGYVPSRLLCRRNRGSSLLVIILAGPDWMRMDIWRNGA